MKWKFSPSVSTCSPVDWDKAAALVHDLLSLNHVDLAWHLWQDFAAQEVSAHSHVQDARGFSDSWFMKRNYQARVQTDTELGSRLSELYRLARRLLDYGKWGGNRVRGRIEKTFQNLATHFSLSLTLEQALQRPQHASEQIYAQAQHIQAEEKRQHLSLWQDSLQQKNVRPTSSLFAWLKGAKPAQISPMCNENGEECTMHDMFDKHRQFWESICRHPTPAFEQATVHEVLNGLPPSEHPLTIEALKQGRARLRRASAPGLDGWTVEAVWQLPDLALATLLSLFRHIEHTGCWPPPLLRTRVTLIQKPDTLGTEPSHWRPLGITSVWYRWYAQSRMGHLCQMLIPWLPDEVLGGVPARSSSEALLRLLSSLEPDIHGNTSEVYAIALDASKCFDRIRWTPTWAMLTQLGVDSGLIRAMAQFYLGHQRYTHIYGQLDQKSWTVSCGLIQGCPLSVMTTVTIVATWHALVPQHTLAQSYVDDRLLVSEAPQQLADSWHTSRSWDADTGWEVNLDKTHIFATRRLPECLQDLKLQQAPSLIYLGHDVRTTPTATRKVYRKRVLRARETCQKISQVPMQITVDTRASLIAMVVTPQWTYGIITAPALRTDLDTLEKAYREALWTRKKHMHCWFGALALVYDPLKHSAEGAHIAGHLLAVARAIRHNVPPRSYLLWNQPYLGGMQGPIGTAQHFCRKLGLVPLHNFRVENPQGEVFFLGDVPKLKVQLRSLLRAYFWRRAQRIRTNYQTQAQIDWETTGKVLRRTNYPHVASLVTAMCDGIWTAPRLVHAGHRETRACWWCDCPNQTPGHLFWDCPRWAHSRPGLLDDHMRRIRDSSPSMHCLVCLADFPEDLKKQWPRIQEHAARVVRGCEEFYRQAKATTSTTRNSTPENSDVKGTGPTPPLGLLSFAPSLPDVSVIGRARSLNFTALAGRATAGFFWGYSQLQWNRLLWFLASVKIVDPPRQDEVCEASVFELYLAYLRANGQARFLSGHPENSTGSRLSAHLESFKDAIQYFQGAASFDFSDATDPERTTHGEVDENPRAPRLTPTRTRDHNPPMEPCPGGSYAIC